MRLLLADVGCGTTDVLVYEEGRELENCPQLVIPSRTREVAAKIRSATAAGRPVYLHGWTMGGGPCGRALKEHLEAGLQAHATEAAALTFNDDIEKVTSWGVRIHDARERPPADAVSILTADLVPERLLEALELLGVDTRFDGIAVAVQDHGFAPGKSNRRHRFQLWRQALSRRPVIASLAYAAESVPAAYTRMRAVAATLEAHGAFGKVVLMDTGPAALAGATAADDARGQQLVVNIGNGHTLAAVLAGGTILGLMEHHTGRLDGRKLGVLLTSFAAGELGDEEVFQDGGHGCIPPRPGEAEAGDAWLVTGPRRRLAAESGLSFEYAAPHGNMMLTGCYGLLEAWRLLS